VNRIGNLHDPQTSRDHALHEGHEDKRNPDSSRSPSLSRSRIVERGATPIGRVVGGFLAAEWGERR